LEALSVLLPGYEQHRTGGEQVQVSLLAKALIKRGFKISLITLDYGQPVELEYMGIEIIKTYSPDEGLPGLRFIYPRVFKLWRALKRADADVYYTSCAGFQVGIVALYCQLFQRRSVYRVAHDNDCDPSKLLIKLWRDKKLYEYGLRRQHAVLAQSEQQQHDLMQYYGLTSNIATMLVDTPDDILNFEKRNIDILWVNNFRQFKRPDLALELAKQLPEYNMHIIGGPNDPELYATIEQNAKTLNNVEFHGPVPYRTISPYYSQAKIFINTSDSEGFPNSYLQSWIRGTPIIVFFDPDEVVSRNGLGYKANSLDEMATLIRTLHHNPADWHQLSQQCLHYMQQHYAEDDVLRPYIEAFKSSIEKK
jgi:glycosyltransferase involved in cell wall biosynthesis